MMSVLAKVYRTADREPRVTVGVDATVRDHTAMPLDAEVLDLSATGIRIAVDTDLEIGETITIGMAGCGVIAATIARRTADGYGCVLSTPISPEDVQARLGETTIRVGPFEQVAYSIDAGDDVATDRWPRSVRVGFAISASGVLWAAIIAGAQFAMKA